MTEPKVVRTKWLSFGIHSDHLDAIQSSEALTMRAFASPWGPPVSAYGVFDAAGTLYVPEGQSEWANAFVALCIKSEVK